MNGKTIRVYLADGAPNGVLTAEIEAKGFWTCMVVITRLYKEQRYLYDPF